MMVNSAVELTVDGSCKMPYTVTFPSRRVVFNYPPKLRGAAVWLATPNRSVLKHTHSLELMTVIYWKPSAEKER